MRPHINFTRELLASSTRVRDNIGVFSIKIIGRSQRTSRAYQIVRSILSVGTSVRFLKDSFDRIVLSRSDYQLSSRRPSPCSVRKILPQLATFFMCVGTKKLFAALFSTRIKSPLQLKIYKKNYYHMGLGSLYSYTWTDISRACWLQPSSQKSTRRDYKLQDKPR